MNSNSQGSNNYHGVVIVIIRVIVINHGVVTKKKKTDTSSLHGCYEPRYYATFDVSALTVAWRPASFVHCGRACLDALSQALAAHFLAALRPTS